MLEPWLGQANFASSQVTPKLRFRVPAEDDPDAQIRLKVEINIAEIEASDSPVSIPYAVESPWFTGNTSIASFSPEELLATKLCALLQRDKGHDLFDLDHALDALPDLNLDRVVELFVRYLDQQGQAISRAETEQRMLVVDAKQKIPFVVESWY
ncbi:MAG: nucleotidyl transferase AbiEii/AbiGii toxin family protein, partial [Rhodobacteraceae bacterium]|nr:nucleotidyl transferase AbiEii/AbiGii toxin family protein [Paracoccaceae bacterium]